MEVAVIASLVQNGMSLEDAKAQVLGGQTVAEPVPTVDPEPEPPFIPAKSKDFSDDQLKLFNEVQAIDAGEGQGSYTITIEDIPEYLFDWIARRALQQAAQRNDPSFGVEKFLQFMIKQERAIDPTKGGKVQGGASGPADAYNPNTERWG